VTSPPLAELLRWISEAPGAARAEPEGFPQGRVRVRAVVADLFETWFDAPAAPELLAAFDPPDQSKPTRNRLRWVLATAHLLWHPGLRALRSADRRGAMERLLVQELARLAQVAAVEQLDTEEERREELARRAVRALGGLLPGETLAQAQDRLKQVDSVERHRVLVQAAEREKRAREVREAMARKAAQEAAAKVTRE
jgi:hypothetical protein